MRVLCGRSFYKKVVVGYIGEKLLMQALEIVFDVIINASADYAFQQMYNRSTLKIFLKGKFNLNAWCLTADIYFHMHLMQALEIIFDVIIYKFKLKLCFSTNVQFEYLEGYFY